MKFQSRGQLAAKVDWEGGIVDALDYGISSDEMPDAELRALWTQLELAYSSVDDIKEAIQDILDEADWDDYEG